MHVNDALSNRGTAVGTGDKDETQEEEADLGRKFGHGVDEAPDQSGGQEAVVEAHVGGEGLGLLGELGTQPEGLATARRGPEEHLEDEDVAVEGGDAAGGEGREDAHC